MSVKLRAVTEELAKLNHAIDADAEKVLNRIQSTHARRDVVMGAVHKRLDASSKDLDEVNTFIDDLEKLTNGGTPISDDSSESSEASGHDGEPGKSWANGQT